MGKVQRPGESRTTQVSWKWGTLYNQYKIILTSPLQVKPYVGFNFKNEVSNVGMY